MGMETMCENGANSAGSELDAENRGKTANHLVSRLSERTTCSLRAQLAQPRDTQLRPDSHVSAGTTGTGIGIVLAVGRGDTPRVHRKVAK